MGQEEVAPVVGGERCLERRLALGRRDRSVGLRPPALDDRSGGAAFAIRPDRSARVARRIRRASSCHHSTSPSPSRQQSQTWRPLTRAGKSMRPVSISRRVTPSSSIRATPACIWSMTPCIRRRSRRRSSAPGEIAGPRRTRVRVPRFQRRLAGELVAERDELRALVAERLEDRPQLGQRGVRVVEVEEFGHRPDSSRCAVRDPSGCRSRVGPGHERPERTISSRPTMRTILLWMAGNRWLRDRLPKLWFARRAVRRFMPGEDAESALAAAAKFRGGRDRDDVHPARRERDPLGGSRGGRGALPRRSSTRSRSGTSTGRSRSSSPSSGSTSTRSRHSTTSSASPIGPPRPAGRSGSTWRRAPTPRARSPCTSG